MGNIVCPARAKKAEAQTTNEDKGATATGYASPGKGADGYAAPDGYALPGKGADGYTLPATGAGGYTLPGKGADGYAAPDGYALPGKDADTTEKRKEDFDKEVPPDNSGQNAAPPVPKLRRALSGNQKPSKKFDEQKALAELARSNPDKYQKYLITHLDELNGKNIDSTVEDLFKHFDADGDGVITGSEYEKLIQKFAEYMHSEFDEKMEADLKRHQVDWGLSSEEIAVIRIEHKHLSNIESMKRDVKDTIDADNDGKITIEEALAGFHKVVDKYEERR